MRKKSITFKEFIKRFGRDEPLRCYTELVYVERCIKCTKGLDSEFPCPFKVLLDYLKEHSNNGV